MAPMPMDKKNHRGKNLVHRILHPNQHKQELEQQEHIAAPEGISHCSVNSSDCEYEPEAHH
ncbi:hypothetical protein BGZ65_002075, partial [Modicella reniformis]